MSEKKYVLGFIFSSDSKQVLLIHKNRPAWQVGKLNGIGGKIEPSETARGAMVRETREECGLKIPAKQWRSYAKLVGPHDHVTVFTTQLTTEHLSIQNLTDERVEWFTACDLPPNVHSNLTWLIPLALDVLTHPSLDTIVARYTQ